MNDPEMRNPAGGEADGAGGRRMVKQPKPEYSAGGGKLLRKWQAIRAAASDKRLSAASDFRVFIVIADRMNAEMFCYPGIETIAADAGVSRRAAIYSINRLLETGYLRREKGGRKKSNLYRLLHSEESCTSKVHDLAPHSEESCTSKVHDLAPHSEESCTSEVKDAAPESRKGNRVPLNPEKEAGEANPARAREDQPPPPPSFEQIIKTYHDILPELPRVEVITKEREKLIRERCSTDLPDIEEWTYYLTSIRQSDFLMGRKVPRDERHAPFQANFDFLIRQQTLISHSEGKYLDPTPGQHRGASRRELT